MFSMRYLPHSLLVALFAMFFATNLMAQELLFSEDFNNCILSPAWEVKTKGNPSPVWYVGKSVLNDDNNGQSMNGSCFLFIDDDATGDNTPAYVIDFVSPAFDASKHSTVMLFVDVHYRDWYKSAESFKILLTDGVKETLISAFDQKHATGDSLWMFQTLQYDLSLLTKSPNARLIFRYDDAGGFNWWTGVDNIRVMGAGNATNIVTESFNGCQKPDGWEAQILTGDANWSFGLIDTTSEAYYGGNSMDGTCFAYFDDDILGDKAPYSTVRLYTPWFDGSAFSKYTLDFDVILRYYKEKISVIVQHPDGSEFLVRASEGDVGGPQFPQYLHAQLDMSSYRNQQMRVAFEYSDGKDFGWWAGIDNVKIAGEGASNDLCTHAVALTTGAACLAGSNQNAVFDGPSSACSDRIEAGLWYKWTADFTGTAKFSSGAVFNDVVNVFTGGCQTLQTVACEHRDEHGFTTAPGYFAVQAGTDYLIRVSGQTDGFGIPRGDLCAKVESAPGFPIKPAHDDCANAAVLTVGAACVSGTNQNAEMSSTLPSLNTRARADVWYQFTAPTLAPGEQLVVESGASFSDIITVYQGGCTALQELVGNHKGGSLELPPLPAGKTYWVQIAGNFATIEGRLCPSVAKKAVNTPVNNQCAGAISVPIGGQCVSGNNQNAIFSGKIPPCVAVADRDIWFKFVAPASGAVRINTGAAFEHTMAVWSGTCDSLAPVFCVKNPLRCEGYILLGSLAAGKTYFLQIASWSQTNTPGTGDVCIKILDGSVQPDFQALTLAVNEVCDGIGTAKIKISAQNGIPPYTFQGTQNGQTLNSGSVYITVVTDAMGCEKSYVAVVKECLENSCTLAASLSPLPPKCHDSADGSLTVNVAGGAQPYQFKWSNNQMTATASGLTGGTYSVTVTDALGCEFTNSATLVPPTAILAAATQLQNPNQGQSNGSILVDIAGGDGNYHYTWLLNSQPFSASEDLTNAPAGNYELRVTDGNNCTASFLYVLTAISGVNNLSEAVFAEVFPNPAQNKATLSIALPSDQTLYLSLLDASGRIHQAWSVAHVSDQNIPLDLRGFAAGTYQLRILCGNGEQLVRKVVVGR